MNTRQKVTGVNPRPQVNVGTRTPKSPTSGEPTKRAPTVPLLDKKCRGFVF
jgi:hypothetical protein